MINKFNTFLCLVLCGALFANAQKQSKQYKETFNVGKDVVLNINTSHADVEFETWNKNTIQVTGLIEIEDATKEEAEEYFKKWNFKALGNSSEVTVSCNRTSGFSFVTNGMKFKNAEDLDLDFDYDIVFIPDEDVIVDIEPLVMEFAEMPPLPPMPPLPMTGFNSFSFDYEAYKKDGDKYLEKWKKEFKKNFDGDYKAEMEKWKEEMEKYKAEVGKLKEERAKNVEKRKIIIKERAEKRKEQLEERKERLEERKEQLKERKEQLKVRAEIRKEAEEARKEARKIKYEIINGYRNGNNKDANFYFYSSDGKEKNLKVKKTIKIKMPKNTRLKLNVRHGEVKLAENTKNIKATLSHARLLANSVDGLETFIEATYSPINIEDWKYGELKVNYIKDVAIDKVKSLKLTANASDVTIGLLQEEGFINGSFGKLNIRDISQAFSNLDVVLDNANAVFVLPDNAFTISMKANNSNINYPDKLTVSTVNKYSDKILKGYFKNPNATKEIKISARYSKVVFE